MSTLAWIVINAVLLGSAIVSVKLAKDLPKELKNEQQQLLSKDKPSVKKGKEKDTGKDGKTAKPAAKPSQPEPTAAPIRIGTLDDIWKKSLFNPDRTELVETQTEQESTSTLPTNSDLELAGIVQIGETPVVIIKQKPQQRGGRGGRMMGGMGGNRPGMPQQFNNNNPMMNRFNNNNNNPMMSRFGNRPGMNGMPLPPWLQQQQQQQQTPQPQGKKIFREGEEINETGYIVKQIIPNERTCIVSKNGRDEELKMEFADTQSSNRKQEAVNYQKEVIAKAEAAARQNNNQNNNQNRFARRGMMFGPNGMQGGAGMMGPGGMQGPPGMMPGGFNRGGFGGNTQGGNQPQGGFNRGGFGGSSQGGGFNRGGFGGAPGSGGSGRR